MTAPARRDGEAGVTLVEMLVALALFALIGLASFSTLDAIVRVRDRTEGRLDGYAALDRALILFGRDLAQSRPGAVSISDGALSLQGGDGGQFGYVLRDGSLVRHVGEAAGAGGLDQRLLDDVSQVGWRFLDAGHGWHDAWPEKDLRAALIGVEMRLRVVPPGGGDAVDVLRLADVPRPGSP